MVCWMRFESLGHNSTAVFSWKKLSLMFLHFWNICDNLQCSLAVRTSLTFLVGKLQQLIWHTALFNQHMLNYIWWSEKINIETTYEVVGWTDSTVSSKQQLLHGGRKWDSLAPMKESVVEPYQTAVKEAKIRHAHGPQLKDVVEESCKYLGAIPFCS